VKSSAMARRISIGRDCLIRFLILIKHGMGLRDNMFFITQESMTFLFTRKFL